MHARWETAIHGAKPHSKLAVLVFAFGITTLCPVPAAPKRGVPVTAPPRVIISDWDWAKRSNAFEVVSGTRRLWEGECDGYAAVVPSRRLVIYTVAGKSESDPWSFVARHYDGSLVWRRPVDFDGVAALWAGGNVLLWASGGPTVGGRRIYDVRCWTDIFASAPLSAFDLQTKRVLWRSNYGAIGKPLWTNGFVFLSVRVDASPRELQRVWRADARVRRQGETDGQSPPDWQGPAKAQLTVWLEERSVQTRGLLWRRRLPGLPPQLHHISLGRHSVRLRFADPNHRPDRSNYAWEGDAVVLRGMPFVMLSRPLSVFVPILSGLVPRGLEASVVYAGSVEP